MFRIAPADQGSKVGVSLNDIAKAYEKKLKIDRWKKKKLLQVENKKKSADDVQHAHARRVGVNVVKVEKQVLGKRPSQEQAVQQTHAKRSILSSRVNVAAMSPTSAYNPKLQHRNRTNESLQVVQSSRSDGVVFSDGPGEEVHSNRRIVDVGTLNVANKTTNDESSSMIDRSSIPAIGGRIFTDLHHQKIAEAWEQRNKYQASPRHEQRLQRIGYTGDNLKMTRQGPLKGSPLAFSMRGPSRGSPMAFRIVNEISNARRMSPRCAEQERWEERKDLTESMTDESNNCKVPLPTVKGKQPAEKQVVYRDGYGDSTNGVVDAAQVLGFTGTGGTENSIHEDDGREGGNNIQEVVMDWTSSSDGAPASDKQASCSSSIRNELTPGHESNDIPSDNDDPNGDTLDSIDVGKAMQEEKDMDEMFKGSAFPSIEEVTQAREPEDGLHFKTRDDAFFFFCTYARKVGFLVKRSTTRRAGPEHQIDKQVFRCTKEGANKTTERLVKHRRSNCLIRTGYPVEITAKRDTDRGIWYLRNVRLEHNHVLHPSDWMLKFMRCYKNMRPEEKFFIQVLQKARLEPRKVMQIFTAMGKPRREIMFDTIDISNIACQDRAGERNTDIEDTMKLFAEMQRKTSVTMFSSLHTSSLTQGWN